MSSRIIRGRGGTSNYATLDVARNLARVRPNLSNTGVPDESALTAWSGSMLFNTPNQVITDKIFTITTSASVLVRAANITFRRCRFNVTPATPGSNGVYWPIDARGTGTGNVTSFYDCDMFMNGVAGSPSPPGVISGFAPSACVLINDRLNGFRLVRCDISDGGDGVQLVGRNITVDSCYVHDLKIFYGGSEGSHNDCMQASNMGNANVRITNNHLDATTGHSAIHFGANGPDTGFPTRRYENFLFAGNYCNGGGFTLSGFVSNPTHEFDNIVVRDNRIGLNCQFGPTTPGRDPRVQWSNNRWDVSGTTPYGTTVTAGQLIS